MVDDLEGFYVSVMQSGITYGMTLVERYQVNKRHFGVQDKVLTGKVDFLLSEFGKLRTPFEDGIKQVNEGAELDELDECIRNATGMAVGSLQSFSPTFVYMNANLCARDFTCNFDNLVMSGMNVSVAVNELFAELMGQSVLPPYPLAAMPPANVIEAYYGTDLLWILDWMRMLPEIKRRCITADINEIQPLMMTTMELSVPLITEYGNSVNLVSERGGVPSNHDYAVVVLSILESDVDGYKDSGFFFNEVSGAEIFNKAMKAQAKKAKPFINKLKKIIKEG